MQIKDSGHLHLSVNTMDNLLYDRLSTDLNDCKQSYLEAVRMCFRFQQNWRREYKRLSARGHQGGEAAAGRNLIRRIVQKIPTAVDRAPVDSCCDLIWGESRPKVLGRWFN